MQARLQYNITTVQHHATCVTSGTPHKKRTVHTTTSTLKRCNRVSQGHLAPILLNNVSTAIICQHTYNYKHATHNYCYCREQNFLKSCTSATTDTRIQQKSSRKTLYERLESSLRKKNSTLKRMIFSGLLISMITKFMLLHDHRYLQHNNKQ